MSDRILLHGMTFRGFHGVFPDERERGQPFIVDVELTVDPRIIIAAARVDDLAMTIDYGAVHADVKTIVEGAPRLLIETVAEEIAARVLEGYAAMSVLVRVRKPEAPLPGPLDYVAVEIVRTRPVGKG